MFLKSGAFMNDIIKIIGIGYYFFIIDVYENKYFIAFHSTDVGM